MLIRLHAERLIHGIPMERFYKHVNITRQAFYQRLQRKEVMDQMSESLIPKVLTYRFARDVRAGSRSLYYNLNIKSECDIGINKFEELMAKLGLTMRPLRTRVVTTKSSFQSWQYSNLLNGFEIMDINQVVAGDLTYVDINQDRYYAFCLTDLYSARIVGLEMSKRMRCEEALRCMEQWIEVRGKSEIEGCIHHTDGGSQYFSRRYLGAIKAAKARISVAQNCLENGYAEQQNSMTKNHFIPTINYYPGMNVQQEMKRIMTFYNFERKQEKLGWLSPVAFEQKWHKQPGRPKIKLHDFEN